MTTKKELLKECSEYNRECKRLLKLYPDMLVTIRPSTELRQLDKHQLTTYLGNIKYVVYHHS